MIRNLSSGLGCCGPLPQRSRSYARAVSSPNAVSSPQPTGDWTPLGPLTRLLQSAREHGPVATARSAVGWSLRFAGGPAVARRVRRARSFELGGVRIDYRDDWHNWIWLHERAVEIPIAAAALQSVGPGRTIEVGAVMSHYGYNGHRVIDQYEHGEGIEQIDIFDLPPTPVHDLVLSVSTLEHVGWDELPSDAELALKEMDHLKRLVAPGGGRAARHCAGRLSPATRRRSP